MTRYGYGTFAPRTMMGELEDILSLINEAKGTKYTKEDIYGVPVKTLKDVEADSNWHNIFDLAQDSLASFTKGATFLKNYQSTPDELGFKDLMSQKDFRVAVRGLDTDSKFRKALLPIFDASEMLSKSEREFAKAALALDGRLSRGEAFGKGKAFFNEGVFDSYPMLTLVDEIRYSSSKQRNVFFDYITLIDRS